LKLFIRCYGYYGLSALNNQTNHFVGYHDALSLRRLNSRRYGNESKREDEIADHFIGSPMSDVFRRGGVLNGSPNAMQGVPAFAAQRPTLTGISPDDTQTKANYSRFSSLAARLTRGVNGYQQLGQPERWSEELIWLLSLERVCSFSVAASAI
jgi:hypothetical protein